MKKVLCLVVAMLLVGAAQAALITEDFETVADGQQVEDGAAGWHDIYGPGSNNPVGDTSNPIAGNVSVNWGGKGGTAKAMGTDFDVANSTGPIYLSALVTWDGVETGAQLVLGLTDGGNTNKIESRLGVGLYQIYGRGPGYLAPDVPNTGMVQDTLFIGVFKIAENASDSTKLDLSVGYFDVSGGSLADEGSVTFAKVNTIDRSVLDMSGQMLDEAYFGLDRPGILMDNFVATTDWADVQASVVPEPATMAILGLGALFLRRKK